MESFVTGHEALFHLAELQKGETVLVHAAAGGSGSAAAQLAIVAGARLFFTARAERIAEMESIVGGTGIGYRGHEFVSAVNAATGGSGIDVVTDFIGGHYLARNVELLREGGRLVQVGLMDNREPARVPL